MKHRVVSRDHVNSRIGYIQFLESLFASIAAFILSSSISRTWRIFNIEFRRNEILKISFDTIDTSSYNFFSPE